MQRILWIAAATALGFAALSYQRGERLAVASAEEIACQRDARFQQGIASSYGDLSRVTSSAHLRDTLQQDNARERARGSQLTERAEDLERARLNQRSELHWHAELAALAAVALSAAAISERRRVRTPARG